MGLWCDMEYHRLVHGRRDKQCIAVPLLSVVTQTSKLNQKLTSGNGSILDFVRGGRSLVACPSRSCPRIVSVGNVTRPSMQKERHCRMAFFFNVLAFPVSHTAATINSFSSWKKCSLSKGNVTAPATPTIVHENSSASTATSGRSTPLSYNHA